MTKSTPPSEMDLRDYFAWNASESEIERFREPYTDECVSSSTLYKHTPERARYRFADALMAERGWV